MRNLAAVIDSSALVLPLVGGSDPVVLRWTGPLISQLARSLTAADGQGGELLVIAEAAAEPRSVTVNLDHYTSAGFDAIYGALGLQPAPNLAGTYRALVPESLGHGVVRYLVSQAVQQLGSLVKTWAAPTVTLIEVGGRLSDEQRARVCRQAKKSQITLIASHSVDGKIPAGMGTQRGAAQEEINALVTALGIKHTV